MAEDKDWSGALCAQVGGDEWFPPEGDHGTAARKTCAGCPVIDMCLQEALERPSWDDHGVWGGTTKRQRDKIRRSRRKALTEQAAPVLTLAS